MEIAGSALRDLHRIHRQLTDVRSRLARGPKLVQSTQANLARLADEVARARDQHKHARVQSDQKQLQLRENEGRILDLKRKLNSCGTNREYQALLEQIAAAEMANSVLQDEILESFEKVDQLAAKITAAEALHRKAEEEFDKLRRRVEAERSSLEADLARLQAELKHTEANLPGDFRADYDRLARSRGEDALAAVEEDSCTGCSQMISPQVLNMLRLARPVFCKSCGRLLYLPEGPTD